MSVVTTIDVPKPVAAALKTASKATGADFDYLVRTAARESAFDVDAQARTSSARGLFQFIENTWLQTVKEQGPRFGLGDYSAFILRGTGGRYHVSDPELRKEILALRDDPDIAAVMAGALTTQNAAHVGAKLGRAPTGGELYIAHFLGPDGATRLISLAGDRPDAAADRYFPQAAKANRSIFYENGAPRSVSEVYDLLARKHGNGAAADDDSGAPSEAAETDAVTRLVDDRKAVAFDTRSARPALKAAFMPEVEADSPVGAIGAWTTFTTPAATRATPKTAEPVRTREADHRPVVAEAPPKRPAAGPSPRGVRMTTAAFKLFADDYMNSYGQAGA